MSKVAPLKTAQVATSDISIRLLLMDHIKALEAAGHQVTAVSASGKWTDDIRARGVTLKTIAMEREASPIRDLLSAWKLCRYFKRERFDVVHTHTPKAGLIGPLAARLARTPKVLHTIHGLLYHDQMPRRRQAAFWCIEKVTATLAHHLLSQSREDIDVAQRTHLCKKSKLFYLGNGIDPTRFDPGKFTNREELRKAHGFAPDDVIAGFVGRLVVEKGLMELAEAAERLAPKYPNLKFVVIGPQEIDQNDALSPAMMERMATQQGVRFVPWVDDMPTWYCMMDIFCLPSHREGIPRACMEAAAMKCPAAVSNIRGCREVVIDGYNGLLTPVRNAPAFSDAVERLHLDRAMRIRMGDNGRDQILNHFDSRTVAERLVQFYGSLNSSAPEQPRA